MTLQLLEDDWAKTMITYFPFYNVKISVKIRDLRAHFALAGQTHSGLVSYLIPSINPGVSTVLFCHDQCYKVTHTAQRDYTLMWPMRSLIYHYMTNQRQEVCDSMSHMTSGGCHDLVMWWEIHDMHSWHNILKVSDWPKHCITDLWLAKRLHHPYYKSRENQRSLLTQFPGSRLLTFLHASDPGPVTTL